MRTVQFKLIDETLWKWEIEENAEGASSSMVKATEDEIAAYDFGFQEGLEQGFMS